MLPIIRRCFTKVTYGYQQVTPLQKEGLVNKLFTECASEYDNMNDYLSFGVHKQWKNEMVNMIGSLEPKYHMLTPIKLRTIDVAGGTGDVSLKILELSKNTRYYKQHSSSLPIDHTIFDMNGPMLDEGKIKLEAAGYIGVDYKIGNALYMPYPNNYFDLYTVSFGLRNMVNYQAALNEAYRVLKPSGKIIILDLSRIQNPTFKAMYDFYTLRLFEPLAKMLFSESKKHHYKYLGESAPTFLNQEELRSYIQKAGFTNIEYRSLNGGITCLHKGEK